MGGNGSYNYVCVLCCGMRTNRKVKSVEIGNDAMVFSLGKKKTKKIIPFLWYRKYLTLGLELKKRGKKLKRKILNFIENFLCVERGHV